MEEKKLARRKEKAVEDGNDENLALACRNLGDFYNQHGRYEEACEEYKMCSNLYSKLGKQLEMATTNRMVGEMYMILMEFDQALKHINIFLKVVKQLGNKVEIQRAYATLGRVYLLEGQTASKNAAATRALKLAEKAFIQSLLVCKELSGQVSKVALLDMQARLYLNIGVVREQMEDFEESIKYMEKAINVCKNNDLHELLHQCYISAGLLFHIKKSDTSSALRFCNLALEISERLPSRTKKECETLIIKAEIMIKEGDFQSAKQVLRKGYRLKSPDINDRANIERLLRIVVALCNTLDELVTTDSDDNPTRKKLYEKMGDGCCLLRNYKKAIDYYLKSLDCAQSWSECEKDLAPIFVSLSQTYKDDQQYDKALEYLWKEHDLNKDEPVEAFNTLCNIGEIYELQSQPFWTTQDCYQKAIIEARKVNNSRLERIASVRLLNLQKKYNMYTLMENLKDEAIKRGIDLDNEDEESDSEIETASEHNTPNIGDDICLDELTDSEDESKNSKASTSRPQRKRNVGLTVKRNNKGETQLHQACIAGNLELARRLIDQGHIVNVRDHAGWLPLHEACNHGYRDIVELLLSSGAAAAINDKGGTGCDGITPLYDACSNGNIEIAELLLERGANATFKTDFGDNVLNVLDKWRNTINLDHFEQAQFEGVRSKIVEQLDKAGMLNATNALQSENRGGISNEHESSLETLCRLGYDDASDDSECGLKSSRRVSKNTLEFLDEADALPNNSLLSYKKDSCAHSGSRLNFSNAKDDYKSVMENLKHPNRVTENLYEGSSKKRSGYMKSDDVGDDWLIEDIRPDKKKRKLLTDRNIYNHDSSRASVSSSNFKENLISCEEDYDDEDDSQDAFRILLKSKGVPRKSGRQKMSRSSGASGTNKWKRQPSLLENGFCRIRSESPQSVDENVELEAEPEPDSTTSIMSSLQHTPQKELLPIVSTISFKIKVEEEMLLIPIEKKKLTEANVRWLAEEASRRYYNLVGLKPVLRLMTTDGFAFEENDLINVALEHNMISAKVLEWKTSSLSQRYEEISAQLQQDVDANIKSALERTQSNCILLNDQELEPEIALPFFKALLHQSTLRILDLSNNFIQDEGCKQLGKSLGTLKQLRTLNLQGNCITSEGLNWLTTEMHELEELCLNYNPLGNASIRDLEQICRLARRLKKLRLSCCKISNFYQSDLNFFELTDFDISFNCLTSSSLKDVFTRLNACKIQNLNLNYAARSDCQLGSDLLRFLQSGTCEKFQCIELAGCNLSDMDVFNIVIDLSKAKDLEKLNLADNSKLTPSALNYVLDNVPHLNKLYMEQCWRGLESFRWSEVSFGAMKRKPELIILSASEVDVATLQEIWDSKHNSLSKIKVDGDLLKMYINDCDVN